MAYFPESIMPERRKDQTEDIVGNPFVVNATDINKHVDEIIAIESTLGTNQPNFPVNYSGISYPSGFSGFSGNPYSFSQSCPTANTLQILDQAMSKIREIRDRMILTTSGVVCILDPRVPTADGNIIFPTDWPTTTLSSEMTDDQNAYDSDNPLPVLPYVTLNDVSDMPETGYISIINELSWVWTTVDSQMRLVIEYPRFDNTTSSLKIRRRNIGTTAEIIRYSGLDTANKRILNVKRRQLGSSSNPHYVGDMVFKGKLSLQVSPSLYAYSTANEADDGSLFYKTIHLQLLQSGKIQGKLGVQTDTTYYDTGHTLYASYKANLVRSIDPTRVFDPMRTC